MDQENLFYNLLKITRHIREGQPFEAGVVMGGMLEKLQTAIEADWAKRRSVEKKRES